MKMNVRIVVFFLYAMYLLGEVEAQKLEIEGCGRRVFVPSDGSTFIIGGSEAKKYSWPWMVAIRVKTNDDNTKFLCGGSLISTGHVLTAAHCFKDGQRNPSDYKIILGSHYKGENNPDSDTSEEGIITVMPTSIKIHESYQADTNQDDIAIMKLDTNIPVTDRIRPICLPPPATSSDPELLTVIGWGVTSFGGGDSKSSSKELRQATFKAVHPSKCRRIFRQLPNFEITENMICAGDLTGNEDSCLYDSGGPLMYENDDKKWIQIGIVSFGHKCAERGFPGIYTDVTKLAPWVRRQIRKDA